MKLKVIITGAHGFIGEGVLLKCLENENIVEVLSVGRWTCGIKHPKLKELIVSDLIDIDNHEESLVGYHACFYCSRIIPATFEDNLYAKFAIEPALSFAARLLILNPNLVFSFLSKHSNLDKNDKVKIDGMVESALGKLAFRKMFFFRVHTVIPKPCQLHINLLQRLLAYAYPLLKTIMPGKVNTSEEIGLAMINALFTDVSESEISVEDIRTLAAKIA
jgi:hypothetical protein